MEARDSNLRRSFGPPDGGGGADFPGGLSAGALKWIAVATMLIDHIGAILYPEVLALRIVGRISFPIFAFLIAEGFSYTCDIGRYLRRMLCFALLSEIPFDLAFYGTWRYFGHQNVMFTFVIALLLLYGLSQTADLRLCLVLLGGALLAAEVLHTDYGAFGVAVVFFSAQCATGANAFCGLRVRRGEMSARGAGEEAGGEIGSVGKAGRFPAAFFAARWKRILPTLLNLLEGPVQRFGVLAAVPLYFYNGEKGRQPKYFFYLFYPVHLFLLYLLWRAGWQGYV